MYPYFILGALTHLAALSLRVIVWGKLLATRTTRGAGAGGGPGLGAGALAQSSRVMRFRFRTADPLLVPFLPSLALGSRPVNSIKLVSISFKILCSISGRSQTLVLAGKLMVLKLVPRIEWLPASSEQQLKLCHLPKQSSYPRSSIYSIYLVVTLQEIMPCCCSCDTCNPALGPFYLAAPQKKKTKKKKENFFTLKFTVCENFFLTFSPYSFPSSFQVRYRSDVFSASSARRRGRTSTVSGLPEIEALMGNRIFP